MTLCRWQILIMSLIRSIGSDDSLEHLFELSECDDLITVYVMLLQNLIDLILLQIDSQFGECISKVSPRDLLLIIHIKTME